MKRINGLAGIFRYYDATDNNFIKVKAEGNKSIFISIPQSNFAIMNGEVLGKDIKLNFKIKSLKFLESYINY